MPAGHRLMLVVDTKDPIYGDATVPGSTVTVRSPSTVELPLG